MGMYEDIEKFHEKFQLPQTDVPAFANTELMEFRIKFMMEELKEFEEAYDNKDLVKAFDALIDLVYVALGTAHIMNLPFVTGWYHVHMANMKKVRAKHAHESKRGTAYDVVKPKGWVGPEKLLQAAIILHEHNLLEYRDETAWMEAVKNKKKRPSESDF